MDIESFRAVILTSSTYRLAGHGLANLTATYDWHSRTSLAVLIPRIALLDCPKYRFLESFLRIALSGSRIACSFLSRS